jgi:hypothetical protein
MGLGVIILNKTINSNDILKWHLEKTNKWIGFESQLFTAKA